MVKEISILQIFNTGMKAGEKSKKGERRGEEEWRGGDGSSGSDSTQLEQAIKGHEIYEYMYMMKTKKIMIQDKMTCK